MVVCLAALAAAVVAGWFLVHSRWFSARVVTVVGSVHTPAAEIEAVAGLAGHPPMVDVDPGAAAARLERLPWVRSATVHAPVARRGAGHRGRGDPGGRLGPARRPPGARPRSGPWWTGTAGCWPTARPRRRASCAWWRRRRPGAPGSWLGAAAVPGFEVAATLPRAFSAQVTAVVVAAAR